MQQLEQFWSRVACSLWFVPALMVLGALLLAVGLVELEVLFDMSLAEASPRLFGAGPDGARGMLTAIASSMITVAGVIFSVTLVALSLSASQYSPRVLRTFTSDRPTQVVLGVFVGIYVYCLAVLRTIRGGDGDQFVPSLAVLGGLLLALVGIAVLVYFIHHLAESVQANGIVAKVATATLATVDRLFPEEIGAGVDPEEVEPELGDEWRALAALRTGYINRVDTGGLIELATRAGRVLRMEAGIGDFVIRGQPLASLEGAEEVDPALERQLDGYYAFGPQRTIDQDAAFGIQQLVDVGCKALSPSVNDPSTAILCVDRVTEILVGIAGRRIPSPYRRERDQLRVVARAPSFESLVQLAYFELEDDARDKGVVLTRLLWSIERVAAATNDPARRAALERAVRRIDEHARRAESLPVDRQHLLSRAAQVCQLVAPTAVESDGSVASSRQAPPQAPGRRDHPG